ncbi:P protein-like [Drosophila innubila]|uniref:P protein-like n=1 Tax=Drosophila innubila TaxID=198719 RepID=UPI00148CA8BD|nr:P protein-like [Drosophila innubila]
MIIDPNPVDSTTGVWLGLFLITFLYILIAFEITDRAFAGVLVSLTALGILSAMGVRPSFEKILSWIDIDTIILLFGMMIMVAILADTGLFDYLSLFAYRLSKGKTWLLLFYLYMFTGILSAFLDGVTMVLMMVPVTIRLCEAVGLHTTLVVISIVAFSNIGGALTPVGDPPNMIIATNSYVVSKGVDFGNFTLHMLPGVVVSMILGFLSIFVMTRKFIYIGRADQMRRSLARLDKLARNQKDDNRDIVKRMEELNERLKRNEANINNPGRDFDDNLNDMQMKYRIRDKILLIKCCVAFAFAISMFLAHSFPSMKGITLCWAATLAALLLLILTDRPDVDKILEGVEWDTLIFFAALFVLMEALVEIGLIDWVSNKTIALILCADKSSQLCVSILLVLWISALASSFVGNIPITTMMLKLTINLATNEELNLPLTPLVWAISFGCCFGGNGTLIGASANVVSAGMANSYGYNINFKTFFILGFPLMIITSVVASIYLLIAHCLFTWH